MKKIGMFYGTEAAKTADIAQKIAQQFKSNQIDIIPVEKATKDDFEKYTHIIIGTSTWFDGELPSYWDETLPEIESTNLKGTKVAIFGLGDQANYAENFLDGVGILAESFEKVGATIVGLTNPKEFKFERSRALRNEKLLGLAIDIENQSEKTDERIENWTRQIKKEFEEES